MVESVGVDVGVSDGVGARVVACTVEEELIEAGTVASSYNNFSTCSSFNTKFEGTVYITPVGGSFSVVSAALSEWGRGAVVWGGERNFKTFKTLKLLFQPAVRSASRSFIPSFLRSRVN